jgi:hypothetical protein
MPDFTNEGRAEAGLHSIGRPAAMRLSSGALSVSAEAMRFEFAVSKCFFREMNVVVEQLN